MPLKLGSAGCPFSIRTRSGPDESLPTNFRLVAGLVEASLNLLRLPFNSAALVGIATPFGVTIYAASPAPFAASDTADRLQLLSKCVAHRRKQGLNGCVLTAQVFDKRNPHQLRNITVARLEP